MQLALACILAMGTFNPIRMAIGVVFMVCAIAIMVIAVKWLLGVAGLVIPQPLMWILGILVFMILLACLVEWAGLYSFNFGG